MSSKGLPPNIQMRHDKHYVEELADKSVTPVGRFIPISKLEPNPEQPRLEIGDITELVNSISVSGVLEPLLVKPSAFDGKWMIIAGERRWRAAQAANLAEVPCVVLNVDDQTAAEIALIENLQRKDLTIWEESQGLLALADRYGYTHDEIARRVGKSRTTITEVLSIANLPKPVREQCRHADINAKSLLLEVVRQPDEASMFSMLNNITKKKLTRDEARRVRRASQHPSPQPSSPAAEAVKTSKPSPSYTYRYSSPDSKFKAEIEFSFPSVNDSDVVAALEQMLNQVTR